MVIIKKLTQDSVGRSQFTNLLGFILTTIFFVYVITWLLFIAGPSIFNKYFDLLTSAKYLVILIFILIAALVSVYLYISTRDLFDRNKSRPIPYLIHKMRSAGNISSQIILYTGFLFVFFVVAHIIDLGLAIYTPGEPFVNGVDNGFYGVIFNRFSEPLNLILYLLGSILIGFHISIACENLFQVVGWRKKEIIVLMRNFSIAMGIVIGLLCSAVPLYVIIMILSQ